MSAKLETKEVEKLVKVQEHRVILEMSVKQAVMLKALLGDQCTNNYKNALRNSSSKEIKNNWTTSEINSLTYRDVQVFWEDLSAIFDENPNLK